jgi:hypothetical protein
VGSWAGSQGSRSGRQTSEHRVSGQSDQRVSGKSGQRGSGGGPARVIDETNPFAMDEPAAVDDTNPFAEIPRAAEAVSERVTEGSRPDPLEVC